MFFGKDVFGGLARQVSIVVTVALASVGGAAAEDAENTVVYFGGDGVRNGVGVYGGFTYALNGDIATSGWVISANMGYATFWSPGSTSYTFDASVLLGYQWHTPDYYLALNLGGDFISNVDTPPTAGPAMGQKVGVIGQVGFETKASEAIYLSGFGAYATANQRIYGQVRVGYQDANYYTYGVEGIYGNELGSSPVTRIGVFVGGIEVGPGAVGVSVGYLDEWGSTVNDGAYLAVEYSVPLRF